MSNRSITHLKAMIRYCKDIEDLQNAFGSDYEMFLSNLGYQYSISFCVEQIGELAKKLREEGYAEKYPTVPWNEIAGLRNRIAHGYDTIDLEMVFDISKEDIPNLLEECEKMYLKEKFNNE